MSFLVEVAQGIAAFILGAGAALAGWALLVWLDRRPR